MMMMMMNVSDKGKYSGCIIRTVKLVKSEEHPSIKGYF